MILGPGRAKALAKEISQDKQTKELVLAENECGQDGLLAIAAAFEKNATIETLSLISTHQQKETTY